MQSKAGRFGMKLEEAIRPPDFRASPGLARRFPAPPGPNPPQRGTASPARRAAPAIKAEVISPAATRGAATLNAQEGAATLTMDAGAAGAVASPSSGRPLCFPATPQPASLSMSTVLRSMVVPSDEDDAMLFALATPARPPQSV
jgi:hypothetical protein